MGGDVKVCSNLARELVNKGHKVTILTTNFDTDDNYLNHINKVKSQGVNVISFKSLMNIGLFIYSPSMKKWLDKEISNYDIIHLHTFRAYQNNLIYNYSKKYNIPYILQSHGYVLPFYNKQNLKKIYDYFWGKKILKDASSSIALNDTEKSEYVEMGASEDKIKIVPNGINLSEYNSLPKKGLFKNRYDIEENERIILYLGRIHKLKGIELLLNAYADVLKDLNNTKLVIVGPDDGFLDSLISSVKDLNINKNVIFTGPLFDNDKMEAYVDAEIFVTPIFSGFPMTFLEACACSLPIITTEKGDKLDWINNNVGLVVKYDKNAIREAINLFITNKKLREKYSENCKTTIKEFQWDEVIEKLENIYFKSIKTKKGH